MTDALAEHRSLIERVAGVSSSDQRLFREETELRGNRQSLRDLHLDGGHTITVKPTGKLDLGHQESQIAKFRLRKEEEIRKKAPYIHAYVLALTWEETDLEPMVQVELAMIKSTFGAIGYNVETDRIDNTDSQSWLRRRLDRFLRYAASDTLLLIFYTGHAYRDPNTNCPILAR
jgi:hypothetical protein